MIRTTKTRHAYTLIELLVVMAIAVTLLTLIIAFGPSLSNANRIDKSATNLSSWLLITKQMAYRDKAPVGLRLIPDPANPSWARELQYIEQPDDIVGTCFVDAPITVRDISPAITAGRVQAGDFIRFGSESNAPPCGHSIASLSGTSGTLSPPGVAGIGLGFSTDFRIHRAFRARVGEENLRMPVDTVIDLDGCRPAGVREVVFSPRGGIVGASGGRTMLWVRGVKPTGTPFRLDFGNKALGEQFLVTIYNRTGQVMIHPVAHDSGDPYSLTTDGRASGL